MEMTINNLKLYYPDYKKTICLDFDGTISHWLWPNTGEIQLGAIEAINKLKQLGFKIVISSCRTNSEINFGRTKEQVKVMKNYLNEHKILFDRVDDGKSGKPIADFYVDDRSLEFCPERGKNWDYIYNRIKSEEEKR